MCVCATDGRQTKHTTYGSSAVHNQRVELYIYPYIPRLLHDFIIKIIFIQWFVGTGARSADREEGRSTPLGTAAAAEEAGAQLAAAARHRQRGTKKTWVPGTTKAP